jgi:trehalose 6-phosphate synthase/phosphatase
VARQRPILVVSNRLPITLQRGPLGLEQKPSAGGLVSALEPVLRQRGGTWIGWPGAPLAEDETLSAPAEGYRIRPIPLSDSEVRRYYHNLSNRALWPLFHSFPERTLFDRRDWGTYDRVNARFAEAAVEERGEADLIWFHDYQLMTAPYHLRQVAPGSRIAFFLHIPFPPFDIFRILPWSREILRGLLACDLVGFHVDSYARNFLDCAERLLGARVDAPRGLVEHGDGVVRVGAFPLGIDFDRFDSRARQAPVEEKRDGEKVVLGVDRLDYTKGIPERIRSIERLLEVYPEHREKVVLLQLAVPSRFQVAEYQELKREIDELVGRVNGRFATADWSPIRYLYRSVPPEKLAAMYRNADIALVTPLRDGMNLVAKEYVASQVDEPGVLILSRMAGAAETMQEALRVNPYNIDSVTSALHRALTMEETERRSRMVALRRKERRYNVHHWVASFLDAARRTGLRISPVTDRDFESWLGGFLKGHQLALFLDYDGTLAPIAEHPSSARLSTAMRAAVEACSERGDTDVTVVSGRALADVQKLVGLPGLTYAGNHGLEIEWPNGDMYQHEDLPHYRRRTVALANELAKLAGDGAWVEEKGATLTFHYREADLGDHADLAERAREVIQQAGFRMRDALCAVEAAPPLGWDKGHAVLHILRRRYGPSWSEDVRAMYAGDDVTDEDAFRVLVGLGMTFRVGAPDVRTSATRLLPNVSAVRALLEWLGRR